MNEIQVFNNETFGSVRAFNISNEVWFAGKDVVEALGYKLDDKNVASQYIKRHCEEKDYLLLDKNFHENHTGVLDYKLLGQRGGYLINEFAIYDLVWKSPLPQAKKFKQWIICDVIPSILKTGSYSINSNQEERIKLLEKEVNELKKNNLIEHTPNPMEELKARLDSIKSEREQVKLFHKAMLENNGFDIETQKKYFKSYIYKYDRLCKSQSNFKTINSRLRSKNYSRVPDEPDFLE